MNAAVVASFRIDPGAKSHGTALAVSPDGRLLAAAYSVYPADARPYDALVVSSADEGLAIVYRRAIASCRALAFSPDGRTLVVGQYAKLLLLEVGTWAERELETGPPYGSIEALAFAPDGGLDLATCLTIFTWGLTPGARLVSFEANKHQLSLQGLCRSPDGKLVASSGSHPYLRIWDAATGRQLKRLSAHHNVVHDVAFSPDGKLLASAGHEGRVEVRSVGGKWPLVRTLAGHTAPVAALAFSPDGTMLASGSGYLDRGDGVRLWNPSTGAQLAHVALSPGNVDTLAWLPDGAALAVVDFSGGLTLVSVKGAERAPGP
jgi:WD40 repeat protein